MESKIQELEKYIYEKFYKGDEFWELVWKYHVLKVKEIALRLAEEEGANKEILLVASILHDISQRDFGIRDHAKKSSEIAEEILKNFDFEEAFIKRVCEIIENHHNYQKNLNKEDVLLKISDLTANLDPILFTLKVYKAKEEFKLNLEDVYKVAYDRISFHWNSLKKLLENLKKMSQSIIKEHLICYKIHKEF